MEAFDYAARARRLGKKIAAAGLGAAVTGGINKPGANSVYFGEENFPAILVFARGKSVLYSAGEKNPAFDETVAYKDFRKHFPRLLGTEKIKSVGIDEKSDLAGLLFWLQKKRVAAKPFGKKMEENREVKEEMELRLIKKAAAVSAELIEALKPFEKTEHEAAGELEFNARKKGFALDAFPPIIAAGANSAIPHSATSAKKILAGDCVVVDAGARVQWYCGDCTRTFYKARDRQVTDAIEAVKEAKKAAEKLAKPGASGKKLADAALEVIKEYGFEKHSFRKAGLSLGHQIGLRVHEGRPLERVRLWKGMAFTIEPGIYVPGRFGVRFEDVITL
ncbi:MAG: M24 family metallopeptidase [Candidatus Micrarchaeota archaeon]|nr:M24 family metallopeptidase [Candidatus Micrarchaeota archaeon]